MSKLVHVQQVRFTDAQRRYLQKQGGTMAEAVRALIDKAAAAPCPTCKGTGIQEGILYPGERTSYLDQGPYYVELRDADGALYAVKKVTPSTESVTFENTGASVWNVATVVLVDSEERVLFTWPKDFRYSQVRPGDSYCGHLPTIDQINDRCAILSHAL